ncbi:39S ribosomal protein L16, mitochondrial [Malassezia brasiliensis]|uniref:39S ribosomal protein L16, mitochondrial n=1 Tax=Malassezia brasiliensis TaxID=1821822 RepID=A0AAF0DTE4_9BASI|nr:39S ribosomal protein L16, mitochondrial [Malassezia brasiliensis]
MFLRSLLGGVWATPTVVRQPLLNTLPKPAPVTFPFGGQQRWASNLGPRRTKYRKAHKGRVSFPTGGSVKGTTVSQGIYGIRTLEPCRLSATQLSAAETALKRKLKVVRGSQVFMRVFPDVPVCVKGNETRMGKGKGSFEYWACRVPVGRVIFEIGGHVEVRKEVAKEALRLAAAKLPIRTEFVTVSTPPRLGREVDANLAANAMTPKSAQP